jgi:hypothetical protein
MQGILRLFELFELFESFKPIEKMEAMMWTAQVLMRQPSRLAVSDRQVTGEYER